MVLLSVNSAKKWHKRYASCENRLSFVLFALRCRRGWTLKAVLKYVAILEEWHYFSVHTAWTTPTRARDNLVSWLRPGAGQNSTSVPTATATLQDVNTPFTGSIESLNHVPETPRLLSRACEWISDRPENCVANSNTRQWDILVHLRSLKTYVS